MTSREERLGRLRAATTWDVVVIGGGATGLGAALDAVTRGHSTVLLDAHDFAKGTSSRSTKLVHGGVRYLARGQIGLVREALAERKRLLGNAPHLVHDLAFLVPAYARWERPYYGLGLWAYDRLAGRWNLGRSRAVSKAEAVRLVPTLEPNGLRGGVVYHDGQFDDARLAVALFRSVDDHGGTALNYTPVTGFLRTGGGRIAGVVARDDETGETFEVEARGVVNATGVFADAVRRLDDPSAEALIAPSQGVHLVLDRAFLPGATAVLVPRTDDGRVLFAIPWNGSVVIGTTDTPVDRAVLEPRPLRAELDFLMAHAARYLSRDPTPADVRSVFAGLRPLIGAGSKAGSRTAKLSREFATEVSDSGLVTITGGKWTTYRKMGESAVGLVERVAGLPRRACVTADLALHGAAQPPPGDPFAAYGSDAPALARLAAGRPDWGAPLHADLPYVGAEVVWASRFEGARTVEDVLARRTRALFLNASASIDAAPKVAALLADDLGRDDAWRDAQTAAFRTLAGGYRFPA